MDLACLFIYSILLIISLCIFKSLKNPAVLFNLWWLILLFVSFIGTPGITHPSERIYTFFLVGGVTFNVVYLFFFLIGSRKKKQSFIFHEQSFSKRNEHTVRVLEIMILFYYLYKIIYIFAYIREGIFDYSNVRSFYYSDRYFSNTLEYLFVNYFVDSIILLSEILFSMGLFKKMFSKSTMLLMITNILIRAIISGGRMYLVEMFFLIFIAFINMGIILLKTSNGRWKIFKVLAISVGLLVLSEVITSGRGREGTFFEKVSNALVLNFTGSFTFLDVLYDTKMVFTDNFGVSMAAGFTDPILSIFRFFNFTDTLTHQIAIGNITSKFVLIGTLSYNAMPTMYYYFLRDFGSSGVIIGPSIFGIIAAAFSKINIKNQGNIGSYIRYALIMLLILESPMNWLLFKSSYAMAFIYLLFFVKKREVVHEKYFSYHTQLQ